jgi:HEAT repeat protein
MLLLCCALAATPPLAEAAATGMGAPRGAPGGDQSPTSSAIAGLDSLAAATLEDALERLDLDRRQLGFDKLYAADDTFRLALLDTLLNDPLAIPGWQERNVTALERCASQPAALLRHLGRLCGVPAPESDSRGSQDGQDAARWPWADGSVPPWHEPFSATQLNARLERFSDQVNSATLLLEQAFAAIGEEERRQICVIAPAFWGGDLQDRGDRGRKGLLHRELGATADTTIEASEDLALDLAARCDRAALNRAAERFAEAVAALANDLATAELPPASATLPGVQGELIAVQPTPWGLCVIGGDSDNCYSATALRQIAFLFEPGGDDLYRGRTAAAIGPLLRPCSALVDYSGDDLYASRDQVVTLGSALFGVAILADLEGNDLYRGEDLSLGTGFFGVGLLYDGAGVDHFEGRNFTQGAAFCGLGALLSNAPAAAPPGPELVPDRAHAAGLSPTPGSGSVPIRYDDNDSYLCARQGQGFAATFGSGLLLDRRGSDTYRAGGRYLHKPLLPNDFQSFAQGFAIGFRPRAGGGVALLLDSEGNDVYNAEVYAQGVGYWYSLGLLADGGGNDLYHATQYAQGAGVHLAVGSLWERGGDDQYSARFGVTQGTAHDLGAACFYDMGGDDTYLVSDGQGVSLSDGVALFIEGGGDDLYATSGGGQGHARGARGFSGAALFLDLEGEDTYPAAAAAMIGDGGSEESNTSLPPAAAANGTIWQQSLYALGIDLPRDITLPAEEEIQIILTAEDSTRSLEELFETASLWEVGSNRERVRRARAALLARGLEAVRYAVAERLDTVSGLDYRALKELARAHPDSFAALALPRLHSPAPRVRRVVIGLLGDLRREEARPELESLLASAPATEAPRIIHALGRIGAAEAAPALRPFLSAAGERSRIATAVALGALRDTLAIAPLIAALRDPLPTVRAAASGALAKIGPSAVAPLAAALEQLDPGHRVLQLRTLARLAQPLRDAHEPADLAARATIRRRFMVLLKEPPGCSRAAERAAACRGLWAFGEAESRAFVRLQLLDESDPLLRHLLATLEAATDSP